MAYPLTADLVAASSGEARDALDALDADQADALRASAIESIENWTRQVFEPETDATKVVDGSGGDVLYLPKRLEAASALVVDGTAIVDDDYAVGELGDTIKLVSPVGGSWLTRVRRTPGEPGPAFATGRNNVSVTGDWGWTDPPQAVIDAIRFDMEDQALADAHKLASTVRASKALGVYQVSQGGLSLSMQGEPGLSMRVKRKLTRYRWRAAGAVV